LLGSKGWPPRPSSLPMRSWVMTFAVFRTRWSRQGHQTVEKRGSCCKLLKGVAVEQSIAWTSKKSCELTLRTCFGRGRFSGTKLQFFGPLHLPNRSSDALVPEFLAVIPEFLGGNALSLFCSVPSRELHRTSTSW
jgi:hypothetical protein